MTEYTYQIDIEFTSGGKGFEMAWDMEDVLSWMNQDHDWTQVAKLTITKL